MMCYVKLAWPEQDILHASLVILQCIGREDEGEREGMGRLCWQLVERFLRQKLCHARGWEWYIIIIVIIKKKKKRSFCTQMFSWILKRELFPAFQRPEATDSGEAEKSGKFFDKNPLFSIGASHFNIWCGTLPQHPRSSHSPIYNILINCSGFCNFVKQAEQTNILSAFRLLNEKAQNRLEWKS